MSADKSPQFYPISWQDVKERVKAVRPELYEVMNDLVADSPELKLYYARYPYGSMIIDNNATFNLPVHHSLTPISSLSIPKSIRDELGYNWDGIPLSLILNGSVDLFMQNEAKQIETYAVYKPSAPLALRAVLDPHHSYHAKSIWRMSAGSRTPFMVPSISNRVQFDKLRKHLNLKSSKPNIQSEHWQFFVELANHPDFQQPWFTELLIFPKNWLKEDDSLSWKLFHRELLSIAWNVSGYARNFRMIERIWMNFTNSLRNKRATPYVLALLKHIIEVSLGETPAYKAFSGEKYFGPFETICDLMVDDYRLKKYTPSIMVPGYLDQAPGSELFISLKLLTRPWTERLPFESLSMMSHLREIQYLLNQFIEYIQSGKLRVQDTPFVNLNSIDYSFYHYSAKPGDELLSSDTVFDDNATISALAKKYQRFETPSSPKNDFLSSLIKLKKNK